MQRLLNPCANNEEVLPMLQKQVLNEQKLSNETLEMATSIRGPLLGQLTHYKIQHKVDIQDEKETFHCTCSAGYQWHGSLNWDNNEIQIHKGKKLLHFSISYVSDKLSSCVISENENLDRKFHVATVTAR